MLVSFPGKILSILNRHVLTRVIRQPLCTWRASLAPVRMNVSSMPLRLKVQMPCTVLMLTPTIVKLIFSILISYPLAGLLKRVPDTTPAYKNLFNTAYVLSLTRLITGARTAWE